MKIYVLLAPGFETIEALTPVDIFKRAKLDVATVSIAPVREVTSSHGVAVMADAVLGDESDLADADLIVLPGGYPGYENLCHDCRVVSIARRQWESGKLLAAICGAPTVLATGTIAAGASVTCHHSVASAMSEAGYKVTGERLTVDHNLVTAAGAGISLHFALTLTAMLTNDKDITAKLFDTLELK